MSELQLQRRILGIDFGRARIGVAVSDELGLLAHPVETISAVHGNPAARIAQIVKEKSVRLIIIGVPRHMNGEIGESAADALAFADKLRAVVECDVVTQDERLSTVAANRALRQSGRKSRETRGYVDQVAAQVILQSYLDRHQRTATTE